YLVIKLHTMTDSLIVEQHRQLAATHPRIRFVEEIDVTPAMAAADILISDVSSVLVEFMGLNRPVVAVNNPRQQEYENYQADDIEYRVRDACLQVTDIEGLLEAVARSIQQPEELARHRMRYAEALCFGRDGRSAERVATAVLNY
ncbi:CDP-glycerol glycerophosphotransferase family protein, partial [bacterium]|nr:CDP-glycerol glycerophosphotransferase family protein [bacterium]